MDNNVYKYKELPLTSDACRQLIIELFRGRVETRQTIINEVNKIHLDRGGIKGKTADNTSMFKKALRNLKDENIAENPIQGYWRIADDEFYISEKKEANTVILDEIEMNEEIKNEYDNKVVVLGEGNSAVYLYYFPTYQINSKNLKKITWPCIIEKTESDPLQRVLNLTSTSMSEKPKVAVIIKTNNAHVLEQAIHNILIYRNKKIETHGNRCFETNPEEFLKIVQFIEQSTLLF